MTEFNYVSLTDRSWVCIFCNKIVPSESSMGFFDHKAGKPVSIYTPFSRYWLPGTKPGLTAGVFCGVECATNHYGGLVGPSGIEDGSIGPVAPTCSMGTFVSTNNENPEGL